MTRGRVPLREQMRMNRAAMRAMCTTPEQLDALERDFPEDAAPKPRAARKPSGNLTEAQIQKAIIDLLRKHPKVAMVNRYNSGSAQFGKATVRFNSARGQSDLMGTLKGGRTFAFEVKSAKGVVHEHQERFLQRIRNAGGIGEVVRSVDDVIRILEAIIVHAAT